MKDATTKQPLTVSTASTVGPYIVILVSQLNAVRQLLKDHDIPHTVDELAISLDGEPEETIIDLGRTGDAKRVQQILDSVA